MDCIKSKVDVELCVLIQYWGERYMTWQILFFVKFVLYSIVFKKRPQFCPEDANKEDIEEFEFVT